MADTIILPVGNNTTARASFTLKVPEEQKSKKETNIADNPVPVGQTQKKTKTLKPETIEKIRKLSSIRNTFYGIPLGTAPQQNTLTFSEKAGLMYKGMTDPIRHTVHRLTDWLSW